MKDGPTMTPEQERKWEEDVKAGRLFKTFEPREPKEARDLPATAYRVLGAIDFLGTATGFSPTLQEIAEHAGLSSRAHAGYLVDKLTERGLVVRGKRYQSRSIGVTSAGLALLEELKERKQ